METPELGTMVIDENATLTGRPAIGGLLKKLMDRITITQLYHYFHIIL